MAQYWGFMPNEGNAYFISYNSLDWQRIAPIAKALADAGYPVWYDYGLQAGTDSWREQISLHLDRCYAVLLFVTRGIFDRDETYVVTEYNEAKGIGKVVIPVFLDDFSDLRGLRPRYRSYIPTWQQLQAVPFINKSQQTVAQRIAYIINSSADIQGEKEKYRRQPVDNTANTRPAAQPERTAPAPQPARPAAQSGIGRVKVGSRVQFGRYPQSSNDPEPITWRVLAVENGRALMISEDLLDCKRFDAKSNNWQSSELRAWLNGEFRNRAFNTAEQQKLVQYKGDMVTCLSIEEAKEYFNDITKKQKGYTTYPERMARPTAYARKNGCRVNSDLGTGWWWLRSPGGDSFSAANVNARGDFDDYGFSVYSTYGGVRPVVSVRL